jgi:DNA replication and repair protein RecF
MVQKDAPYFMIKGHFEGNIRSGFDVSCSYARGEGKRIFINDSPLDRFSDLIGRVPVVVLAPQDRSLTSGGPSERRSFIDSLISQISSAYLRDLIDFRKVRKQRNTLLQDFRGSRNALRTALEPWNVQLIRYGSRIIAKRTQVLNQFQDYLTQQYDKISGMQHRPHLKYQTFCEPDENEDIISERYARILDESQEREFERELSIVGPHRDEIVFYLNDFELRKFGSQGQHRLFALSIKIAQLFYFAEQLDDLPLFLLDDVFGDLDTHRTNILLETLSNHAGQTFITSANAIPSNNTISFDNNKNRKFMVEEGNITIA